MQTHLLIARIAGILSLFVLAWLVMAPTAAYCDDVEVGSPPPDFTAETIDGEEITLSDFAGEMPVVLDFWATWCGPCRSELPLINEFAETYDGEVMVIGIATWEEETPERDIRSFAEDQGFVFQIIHDVTDEISEAYAVEGIPYVVAIDADGNVAGIHLGFSESIVEELETELDLEGGGEEPAQVEEQDYDEITVGMNAPDFTAEDLDGNEFTLSDMIGEMPVVIDFWATWCGPCRMEIPLVNDFADEYGDEVMVVGLACEEESNIDAVREFIEDEGLVFPIFVDSSGELQDLYRVSGIPFVIAVNADGEVVGVHLGYSESIIEELEDELDL